MSSLGKIGLIYTYANDTTSNLRNATSTAINSEQTYLNRASEYAEEACNAVQTTVASWLMPRGLA